MRPEGTLLAGSVACALAAACGEGARDAPSAPPPSVAAPPAPSSPAPISPSAVEAELETAPVELLKFQFTSAVKDREPVDRLEVARPGSRVYAHLTLRNRTGRDRGVHVEFLIEGKKRTELDLPVKESWSFRTWGYNTLQAKDRGALVVSVTDDEGHPLGDFTLPIAQ
jgi:hypothetical protein